MSAAVASRRRMNAVLVSVLHFPVRSAGAFFDAIDQADKAIERTERLEWLASFAPTVTRFGSCTCGSVYEDRSERIELTDGERDAVADGLGGATHFADIVVDAINAARDRAGQAAHDDWCNDHVYCDGGDDL